MEIKVNSNLSIYSEKIYEEEGATQVDENRLKQSRSIKMHEKIKTTALMLFCEKGYHEVTTNEIAKVCDISIGSLYFHFRNKDDILLEILDDYHAQFLEHIRKQIGNVPEAITREELRGFLILLINSLIESHERTKDFNQELMALSYSKKEVRNVLDINELEQYQLTKKYLLNVCDCPEIKDLDYIIYIILDMINSVVDRVVFHTNHFEQENYINNVVDCILTILYN